MFSFSFSYLLREEPRPGLLKLRRRSHVRKSESFAEIDLRDRYLRIHNQLLADILHAAVVVVVERRRSVRVYPLVVNLKVEECQKGG